MILEVPEADVSVVYGLNPCAGMPKPETSAALLPAQGGIVLPACLGVVGPRVQDSGTTSSFRVHPAVLDSCLHVGAYLGTGGGAPVRVPAGFEAYSPAHLFGEAPRYVNM
jgi:hypothetical protein